MKANIFKRFLLACGLFGLTGCQMGLDLQPKDRLTDNEMWQDQKLVVMYTNNFYSQLTSGFNNPLTSTWLMSCITDDAMVPSTTSAARTTWVNPTYTSSSSPLNSQFGTRYKDIRRANVFLSKIDQVPGDPDLNKRLKAEVRFLRAYYYYDLVQWFGGVPIITVPQDINDENLFRPRNTLAECQDFIIGQLDSAATDLPTTYPSTDAGRITKQAAWGLKCRVQMVQEKWADAAATAKAIMDLGKNDLMKNASNPQLAYTSVFTTANNTEMILSVQHDNNKDQRGTQFDYNTISPYYGGALGNNCPTQNLVDDYEMQSTGKSITDGTSGYNVASPYLGRDPRFYATILYDGAQFRGRAMQMHTATVPSGGALGQDVTVNNALGISADKITPTGYYLKKFTNEGIIAGDANSTVRSSYNWPLIRYAEILLNYAEAQNEVAGADGNVYAAVNAVRQRAGMPVVPAGLSQTQMRNVIRHERRIELAFEDFRYWDVKRWKLAETLFSNTTPIRKAIITLTTATGAKSYNFTNTVSGYNRSFLSKNYLFPIPLTELQRPGNLLTQNTGWEQ